MIKTRSIAGQAPSPSATHSMALISQAGFVRVVFIVLTIAPDCVVGARTRLLQYEDSGVAQAVMPSNSTSSGLRLTGTQGSADPSNSWRKLLARPVDSSESDEAAASTNHRLEGQASKSLLPSRFHSHFAAASRFPSFSFFASMAKGSTSPSPATPSPGHN